MAIKVADQILDDPQNNVNEVLKKHLGYEKGVKGFFTDPWNLLFFGNPLLLGGRVLYRFMRIKKRQRMEMEMMKRKIIAKQQAIIRRLEQENNQNEEQRQNLQETIDFLEETLKRIEDSRNNN